MKAIIPFKLPINTGSGFSTIRGKLLSIFLGFLIMVFLISFYALYQMNAISHSYNELIDKKAKAVTEAKDLIAIYESQVLNLQAYVNEGHKKYVLFYTGDDNDFKAKQSYLAEKITTTEGNKLLQNLSNKYAKYKEQVNAIIQAREENREDEQVLRNQLNLSINETGKAVNDLAVYCQYLLDENNLKNSKVTEGTIKNFVIAIFLLVFLGSVILYRMLNTMIHKPIVKMVSGANIYAKGDFRNPIDFQSKDELGDLAKALNKMQESFNTVLLKLKESSGEVNDASKQLTAQTEQTAAGISETAVTMNEISSTIEHISENMQIIAGRANSASEHADNGYYGVEQVGGQMTEIVSATREIGSSIEVLSGAIGKIDTIVQVITAIADQTNLLALNAAIEAARAGESGRGFAVVAEEVRKLAEQSARSTSEIKSLIKEINEHSQNSLTAVDLGNKKVEDGIRVVNEVGQAFHMIISTVKELNQNIKSVATFVQQVTTGIENVAATTEQETATMEEAAAATESISKLVDGLNEMIGRFKV